MPADPDRFEMLHFSEEFLAGRAVRFLPKAEADVVTTVRLGVVFFMAFWSGPARQGFTTLKTILSEVDLEGRLECIVVDIDGCGTGFQAHFAHPMGGWGEIL